LALHWLQKQVLWAFPLRLLWQQLRVRQPQCLPQLPPPGQRLQAPVQAGIALPAVPLQLLMALAPEQLQAQVQEQEPISRLAPAQGSVLQKQVLWPFPPRPLWQQLRVRQPQWLPQLRPAGQRLREQVQAGLAFPAGLLLMAQAPEQLQVQELLLRSAHVSWPWILLA
jgi:hypothetical protein